MAKVIHVHLLHNIDESRQKDWYFSKHIGGIYCSDGRTGGLRQRTTSLHAGLSGNGDGFARKRL